MSTPILIDIIAYLTSQTDLHTRAAQEYQQLADGADPNGDRPPMSEREAGYWQGRVDTHTFLAKHARHQIDMLLAADKDKNQ